MQGQQRDAQSRARTMRLQGIHQRAALLFQNHKKYLNHLTATLLNDYTYKPEDTRLFKLSIDSVTQIQALKRQYLNSKRTYERHFAQYHQALNNNHTTAALETISLLDGINKRDEQIDKFFSKLEEHLISQRGCRSAKRFTDTLMGTEETLLNAIVISHSTGFVDDAMLVEQLAGISNRSLEKCILGKSDSASNAQEESPFLDWIVSGFGLFPNRGLYSEDFRQTFIRLRPQINERKAETALSSGQSHMSCSQAASSSTSPDEQSLYQSVPSM